MAGCVRRLRTLRPIHPNLVTCPEEFSYVTYQRFVLGLGGVW